MESVCVWRGWGGGGGGGGGVIITKEQRQKWMDRQTDRDPLQQRHVASERTEADVLKWQLETQDVQRLFL